MSTRRRAPGPGRQVATGTLRVDAGRAVAKLREYQLPDPSAWILEALRALVAAGATSVEVNGDADDLWLRARGTEARARREADALGRLFDELVSPEVARGRRWLRLLATAVNTALGLDPRFVDVVFRPADEVLRIRYVPGQLDVSGDEGANLEGALTPLAPDALAPDVDFMLHVRRAPSLAVFGRMAQGLFGAGELPELAHLRLAAADAAVPVRVGPQLLGAEGRDLVRVPLTTLPKGWRGFLALADPASSAIPTVAEGTPSLDLAEHGVLVERLPLPGWVRGTSPLPLRVVLDAERLPTNASRSKVRMDDRAVRRALGRAEAAVPALGEAIAAAFRESEGARLAALRRSALHVLAGYDARETEGRLPKGLRPLLELPLLRDAIGRPRTLASFPGPLGQPAVYQQHDPLDPDLAPFAADLPWIRAGDDAAQLFHGEALPDAGPLLRAARRSLAARRRWERTAPREPRLPPQDHGVVLARFAYPDAKQAPARFRGVAGELRLLAPGAVGARRRGLGEVTVLLEGREIERLSLASPWPFVAIVTGPGLVPKLAYDGVEDGARKIALVDALRQARDAALGALYAAAAARPAPAAAFTKLALEGELPSREALLRGALEVDLRRADASLKATLFAAPLCPEVLDDGTRRFASFAELAKRAKEPSWLIARPGDYAGEGVPPAGRSALCLAQADAAAVLTQVAGRSEAPPRLLRYALRDATPTPMRRLLRHLSLPGVALVMVDEAPDHRGVIAWGVRDAAVHLFHRGERVGRAPFEPALGPCAIARDDDALVPTEAGELAEPAPRRATLAWEGKALMALVRGIAGEAPDELVFEGDLTRARTFHRGVLLAAASPRAARVLDEKSRARIRALPLVRVHGKKERVSLEALRAASRVLLWLPDAEAPRFDTPGFAPVLADEELARALARLGGLRAKSAQAEADAWHVRRERETRLAALERGPTHSLPPADARSVRWDAGDLEGWVSLAPAPEAPALVIEVRVDGRPLETLRDPGGLPLRCILDGDLSLADEQLAGVDPKARRRLFAMARAGGGKLLDRLAERTPEALHDDDDVRALLGRWAQQSSAKETAVRDRLAAAPAWPTVQGPRAAVAETTTKARIRVGTWDGAWLGPGEGEAASAYDAPTLRLPGQHAAREELESIWRHLAPGKRLGNRTQHLRALQGERMLARKLVPVPTLPDVPAYRKASLEALQPEGTRRGVLGPGEIGLGKPGTGELRAFAHGQAAPVMRLTHALPLLVVTESPRLGDAATRQKERGELEGGVATRLQAELDALAPALLGETLLKQPSGGLAPWERGVLRSALLEARLLTPDAVRDRPLFETTAGDWVSLEDLAAQQQRFGDVWWTGERSYLERSRVPHDPQRVALRLTPGERDGLRAWAKKAGLTLVDAAEELRLDERLRRNLARPPRRRFDIDRPTLGEADVFRWKGAKGSLALLRPEDATHEVQLFRRGIALGTQPLPGTWPTLARVDDPSLTPDRVHGAAVEDARLRDLLRQLRRRSDALLDDAAPREAPADALAVAQVRAKASRHALPGGAVAVGTVFLPASVRPEGIAVRGAALRTLRPAVKHGLAGARHLAVGGTLLAHVPGKGSPLPKLDALVRAEARGLLKRTAARLAKGNVPAESRELALAHVLRGAAAELVPLRGALRKLAVPGAGCSPSPSFSWRRTASIASFAAKT
ncbi:MAG: hypothetical protein AAF447_14280, partial [Myxococcota bacterium]